MRHLYVTYLTGFIIVILTGCLPAIARGQTAGAFDSKLSNIKSITNVETRLAAMQQLEQTATGIRPAQYVRYYEALLNTYTQLKNDSGIMVSNSQLASFYVRTNRFDEALSHYFSSLHIAEMRRDYEQQITCYLRIGFTYKSMAEVSHHPSDLDKAMSYSERAMEISRRYGIKDRLSGILTNMGIIHDIRKEHGIAIRSFRSAIRQYGLVPQRKINPGDMWMDLAIALKNNKDFNASLSAFDTARRIYDTAGTEITRIILTANVAHLYDEMGRLHESEALAVQALNEGVTKGYDEVKADIYELLAKLYKKQQRYTEALDYTSRLLLLKDSILTKQRTEQIADMQTRYETELKDKQIITQEARISANRKLNALLWASVVLLLSIGIIIFLNQRRTKRLYIQISQQSKELERLNGVKDRLFSTISHDMRAPVSSLMSFTMLLDGGNISPQKLAGYAAELKNTLGYTATLMENLLSFARSQMQGYNSKPERIHLASVTTDALGFIQSAADQKMIVIVNEVSHDMHVTADADMLALVMRNLLGNAVKFTRTGGTITLSANISPDQLICWAVADTGIGIAPSLVAAFNKSNDKEEQPLESTPGTLNEKGTGLGLMLSKTFLVLMGGRITLTSAEGAGSTFTVCLPVA